MVTLHHFTDPIWVNDLSDLDCVEGPGDDNLCGWREPQVAEEFAELAREVGLRFGDLVDTWSTFNEPLVYLTGYVLPGFPPAIEAQLSADAIESNVRPVFVGLMDGHVRAYDALHAADTADADGDGTTATVGFTNAYPWFVPADAENPADVDAARTAVDLFAHAFADGAILGQVATDLVESEPHPEWAGTVDLLGVQYYGTMAVVGTPGFALGFIPCDPAVFGLWGLDPSALGCPEVPVEDTTDVGQHHEPRALVDVVDALVQRYPGQALRITENGRATSDPGVRAKSLVDHVAVVHELVGEGAPIDGYIHWTLMDNFEWRYAYTVQFGLFTVDRGSMVRSPTVASEVYAEVAAHDGVTASLLDRYGH
jgi:beta-glucosidase